MAVLPSTELKFKNSNATLLRANFSSLCILAVCCLFSSSANAITDLLTRATQCSDSSQCIDVMMRAVDPRSPEAIGVAAARIGEFQKPPRGNRKASRNLNATGLTEFKKGNFAESVIFFQQGVGEDPSDVEVQSNLGFALLRANRLQDARQVLRTSLAINPRRTSAWVPMADVLFEMDDFDNALASLLLAYEFSENREKTRIYFDNKATSADRIAPIYALALKKLAEPRASVEVIPAKETSTPVQRSRLLTKAETKTYLLRKMDADPEIGSDKFKKEMLMCVMDGPLDEAYRGSKSLDMATIESKLGNWASELKKDDPEVQLRMMKCLVNSPTLEKAMKEKGDNKSAPSSSSSAQLLDIDDLRLDMASLEGKKVRVKGFGHHMMDVFMLKKSKMDMSPMIVDVTKLPRDQRKQIISQCSDIMSGCAVTIHGTVEKVNYRNGLVAERVEW